jgi:hypothetical protein
LDGQVDLFASSKGNARVTRDDELGRCKAFQQNVLRMAEQAPVQQKNGCLVLNRAKKHREFA